MPKSAQAPRLTSDKLRSLFRVEPGTRLRLKDHDPGWMGTPELRALGKDEVKQRAKDYLARNLDDLAAAQELLWASDTHALLVVLQAMDAAGKDGTIKHVMSGVNPQGCAVHSFKQPSAEDLDHTFLWRYMKALPERGKIVVFNRSHYEDVLVTRVRPELLDAAKLPPGKRGDKFWKARYDDINAMERHLVRNGVVVLKFFLNVSRDEQRRRFLERIDNPEKHWKFSAADLEARARWDDYMEAYEEAITRTSTEWAPWLIVPADHKFVSRALVAYAVTQAILDLDLEYPKPPPGYEKVLADARRTLTAEKH